MKDMLYHSIRFQENVKPIKGGNTFIINSLVEPLDDICEDLGGASIGGVPTPTYNRLTRKIIQIKKTYLVGTSWVENDVNLDNGKKTTDVIFLDGHENQKLIKKLESLYGKKNIFPGTITIYNRKSK